MAFTIRFDTPAEFGYCIACILFFCLLPFGSFVAFCIYLSNEDCLNVLNYNNLMTISNYDSNLSKWIKKKLNKHIGFILGDMK